MYVTLSALVIALLGADLPAAAVPTTTAAEGVTIRLDFPAQITLGEPMVVDFIVENTLAVPVTLDVGMRGIEHMKVTVTGPDGRRQPGTFLMREGISASLGFIRVDAHETSRQPLFLLEWFTSHNREIVNVFAAPGAYTVEFELTRPIQGPSGVVIPRPATQMFFQILPRDEAALRARAERLAATVIARKYRGREAAKVLAEIRDVQAIPSIRQVLQDTDLYDWILIQTLVAIRDKTARDVLEEYARSGSGDRRVRARDALLRRARSGIDQ